LTRLTDPDVTVYSSSSPTAERDDPSAAPACTI
jgi:hypothetical protein